eukprot:CAMPEP_0118680058 /NCGR_PEP_ID=MMETSP0800-20121206/4136_1 /TAXON_ID=210618 ORGANISM="Striatella unipunctata, Strain CCMP2910" /NCGR_SAMPLE_ID=MMETSP0800 /ASSEMBLY_ACC=CAM_ASM_000638 /LENGTH=302 /DNA_ID=CAMNT_0006576129 /DNA_START=107 /DNA_END=1015 /DNA_ORIENTATION=-
MNFYYTKHNQFKKAYIFELGDQIVPEDSDERRELQVDGSGAEGEYNLWQGCNCEEEELYSDAFRRLRGNGERELVFGEDRVIAEQGLQCAFDKMKTKNMFKDIVGLRNCPAGKSGIDCIEVNTNGVLEMDVDNIKYAQYGMTGMMLKCEWKLGGTGRLNKKSRNKFEKHLRSCMNQSFLGQFGDYQWDMVLTNGQTITSSSTRGRHLQDFDTGNNVLDGTMWYGCTGCDEDDPTSDAFRRRLDSNGRELAGTNAFFDAGLQCLFNKLEGQPKFDSLTFIEATCRSLRGNSRTVVVPEGATVP